MKQMLKFVAAAVAVSAAFGAQAQVVAKKDRFSDVVRAGLPLAAAGVSLYKDDIDGFLQLAASEALSAGSTELLKRGVKAKRPDGRPYSFPSGHASMSFAAATYMHQRYSLQWALPFYGLATLSGIERVRTHNHFARDVVGGAAVGIVSALVFTGRYTTPRSALALGYWDRTITLDYATTW